MNLERCLFPVQFPGFFHMVEYSPRLKQFNSKLKIGAPSLYNSQPPFIFYGCSHHQLSLSPLKLWHVINMWTSCNGKHIRLNHRLCSVNYFLYSHLSCSLYLINRSVIYTYNSLLICGYETCVAANNAPPQLLQSATPKLMNPVRKQTAPAATSEDKRTRQNSYSNRVC